MKVNHTHSFPDFFNEIMTSCAIKFPDSARWLSDWAGQGLIFEMNALEPQAKMCMWLTFLTFKLFIIIHSQR